MRYASTAIALSAAKPRTVLATLAVNVNTVVPMDVMISELWGHLRPRSAKAVIQTYILQLRKHIATVLGGRVDDPDRVAKQLVATRPGGYVLNADDACVDMQNFDRLAMAGHRERELGDLQAASRNFSEALSWWQGRPLLDVQTGLSLDSHVRRLEESRLNVLDRRIEVDLRLGRHYELLGELTALVGQYQTHEGLCAHLMLALYRSGRRSEALDVYRRVRTRMVEDLALEPSPALRRLHRSMLVSDRSSGSLTDDWQAVSTTSGAYRSLPGPRQGTIPVELAAASWRAQPEAMSAD
ncbi:hypothetical protein GCM10023148_25230 [Actinokineospora soli]